MASVLCILGFPCVYAAIKYSVIAHLSYSPGERLLLLLFSSELGLKQSLVLIQLIKTQLMFALMAPRRQPQRQASVIPASDGATSKVLWLTGGRKYPTEEYHTL